MATLVIKTIKSSGGDYTSLSAFEAALPSSLVTNDEVWEAKCYLFQDTTAVLWSGATTDATRYVRVYAADEEGARCKHIGKRGTGYRLNVSAASTQAMDVRVNHIRFDGLEVSATGASSSGFDGLNTLTSSSDVRVENCLIYDCGDDGIRCGAGNWKIGNNILVGNGRQQWSADYKTSGDYGTIYFHNNFCAGNSTGGGGGRHFNPGSTVHATNNYFYGSDGGFVGAASLATNTTNASYDGTIGSTISYSTSAGTYFVSTTNSAQYLQVKASSSLTNAGTDLSAHGSYPITTDIWGNTRTGTFDIGAIDTGLPKIDRRSILASGGSYTSTASWESASPTDLVAERTLWMGELGAIQETVTNTIAGQTTDADHYMHLKAVGAGRHSGVWNASAYTNTVNGIAFDMQSSYTRLEGVQVHGTNAGWDVIGVGQANGRDYMLLEQCIIRGTNAPSGGIGMNWSGSFGHVVRDNIVYDCDYGIYARRSTGTPSYVINNTVHSCTTGLRGRDGNVQAWNNLAFGNTADWFATNDWDDTNSGYNAYGNNGTACPGSTDINLSSYVNADIFIDATNDNFHLYSSGSAYSLLDNDGVGPSSNSNVGTSDIDGDTRSGTTTSIGADLLTTAPSLAQSTFRFRNNNGGLLAP